MRPPRKRSATTTDLPSEQAILEFLAAAPQASGKRDIARHFGIRGNNKIKLKQLLKDLQDKGSLERKRRKLAGVGQLPHVTEIDIQGADHDGELYGTPIDWPLPEPPTILIQSSKRDKLHVRPPKVGDRILATIEATPSDDAYPFRAKVLRFVSTRQSKSLGIFRETPKGLRVLPIDKKAKHDFNVSSGHDNNAKDGELVSVELMRGSLRGGLPSVRVLQRLGNVADPRNVSLIAIQQHGILNNFPTRVEDETKSLAAFKLDGRKDYRDTPLITIDPADARDHDDAIYAEPLEDGGHKVIVAIADVAAYVRSGTALDREARLRGNSTYFPDRVVPMLPERISNDLCSLREAEDRPALVCEMFFDKSGKKKSHKFFRGLMRSAAKLSYQEAQAAIDGRSNAKTQDILDPVLKPLWAAYRTLAMARDMRSPLELDLPERKIILDKDGNVEEVLVPERLDAHRLVEEFMIQANVAAAEELEGKKSPLLYRIHEEPAKEKIRALMQFLKTIGRDLALGQVLHTKHFNTLLHSVKGEEFERVVHEVVLRTQSQAVYSHQNAGHFGLSLRRYAHFTSPIRRYADLIVHRALVSALKLGDDGLSQQDIAQIEETADMISAAERRSMIAERETIDRLIAAHLAGHVGASFEGRISGVVGAGLFVKLAGTGADGFVPAATLGQDYYVFDDVKHALIGQRSRETYQLGDTVTVRLKEVAPVKGGLRFEMISEGKQGAAASRFNTKPKLKGRRRK